MHYCKTLCSPFQTKQLTWRSVEEYTLAGRHAKLEELVGMLDGVLHQLLQLALDVLQTADVIPRDIGHLHGGFTQRARVALAQSPLKRVRKGVNVL